MNRYDVSDGETRFIRVSKRKAKQLFDQNIPIYFCPVKLRPGFPFSPGIVFQKTIDNEFDRLVKNFEWYNCNMSETGYYASFYTMESIK